MSKHIENKIAKQSTVRGGFSRVWDARNVIVSDIGGQGALLAEPGVHCEDFWDYYDFEVAPARNSTPMLK